MLADLRRTVYEVSCPSLYDVMTGMLAPSHVVVYCRRGVSDWLYSQPLAHIYHVRHPLRDFL